MDEGGAEGYSHTVRNGVIAETDRLRSFVADFAPQDDKQADEAVAQGFAGAARKRTAAQSA